MKIDFASRKFILLLVFVGFVWAISINEINLAYIKSENPQNNLINGSATMYGFTVWSVDNEWYLPQIKHILSGNGYTLDPKNPELSVRRTPVYPLFYGLHYIIFGEEYSFFVIRYTQVAIHLLAIILLGQAIYNISSESKWAKLASILYAINPFTISYLYTTITESLTPSITIFILFAFSLCFKFNKPKNFFFLGLIISFGLLHRPSFVFWIPAILLGLVIINLKSVISLKLNKSLVYLFLSFFIGVSVLIIPWTIRNYFSTNGDIVFLEKYYYGDPMDYGEGHIKFREWIGSWENPANFLAESYSNEVRFSYDDGKTDVSEITKKTIEKMPNFLFEINSKQDIENALNSLNKCFYEKHQINISNPALTRKQKYEVFTCENIVVVSFETLKDQVKSKSPLRYYFITPIKYVSSLVLQSGSYAYAILNPITKQFNPVIFVIKSVMYVLNTFLFISIVIFCIPKINQYLSLQILCGGFVITTFLVTIYIMRYAEARYIIPMYPILYLAFSYLIIQFLNYLRLKNFKIH